jgi:hypothetical protein
MSELRKIDLRSGEVLSSLKLKEDQGDFAVIDPRRALAVVLDDEQPIALQRIDLVAMRLDQRLGLTRLVGEPQLLIR